MRGGLARIAHLVYGLYVLLLLVPLLSLAGILALVVPILPWRRACTRGLARLWLGLSGLMPRISGLDHLPTGPCVLIANHSSYLDGVLMKAALPPRFSFVIKREAAALPGLGFLLSRIGSQFVDRTSHGGRQRDARRVVKHAEAGHSLVFFPEGTFDGQVGLKRFHLGAFVAAARSNVPLVPAVIHGARRALPHGRLLPRPVSLSIEILEPLLFGDCAAAIERLREQARRVMLERLQEPDLAAHAPSTAAGTPRPEAPPLD
jgi:1-acyl-sn-glycerol-3-phosphate acyltransferase